MSEQIAHVDKNPEFNGVPTQRLINLYEKFGHGGWGVVVTGNVAVDQRHVEGPGVMIIDRDMDSTARRNQFRRLAEAAKFKGSLIIAQLNHTGRQTPAIINATPFSASDVLLDMEMKGSKFGSPVPLTTEQVRSQVVDKFVYAALYAYETGFNGIQLNAAFGYLLSQFLSPNTNKRTDQYGGPWQNRVKVLEEIYKGIRTRVPAGSGFVISVKLNSAEFQEGGLEQNEVIAIVSHLDKIGVDFIELTGGNLEAPQMGHVKESTRQREAYFIEFANAIKPNVQNAVIYLTGGFKTAPAMVQAIKNNDTDGVGLARAAAAEPDLPKRILEEGIQASALNPFHDDFMVALPAANSQLAQAGSTDVDECKGNLTYGLSDFSNPDEADAYKTAMFQWFGALCEAGRKGKAEQGVFEYHTRTQHAKHEHKGLLRKILEAI